MTREYIQHNLYSKKYATLPQVVRHTFDFNRSILKLQSEIESKFPRNAIEDRSEIIRILVASQDVAEFIAFLDKKKKN